MAASTYDEALRRLLVHEGGYRQPKPRFDPTINCGHSLTAVSFIVAGAGAYYGMRAELQNVDQRVEKSRSPCSSSRTFLS